MNRSQCPDIGRGGRNHELNFIYQDTNNNLKALNIFQVATGHKNRCPIHHDNRFVIQIDTITTQENSTNIDNQTVIFNFSKEDFIKIDDIHKETHQTKDFTNQLRKCIDCENIYIFVKSFFKINNQKGVLLPSQEFENICKSISNTRYIPNRSSKLAKIFDLNNIDSYRKAILAHNRSNQRPLIQLPLRSQPLSPQPLRPWTLKRKRRALKRRRHALKQWLLRQKALRREYLREQAQKQRDLREQAQKRRVLRLRALRRQAQKLQAQKLQALREQALERQALEWQAVSQDIKKINDYISSLKERGADYTSKISGFFNVKAFSRQGKLKIAEKVEKILKRNVNESTDNNQSTIQLTLREITALRQGKLGDLISKFSKKSQEAIDSVVQQNDTFHLGTPIVNHTFTAF